MTSPTNNESSPTPPSTPSKSKQQHKLHIVFLHLDLGIGGAEQLVLQLATASQDLGHDVDIVTTRCDQDHCFDIVQKSKGGRLANNVYVYGRWIPPNILGVATALMSTLRMLYLTYKIVTATTATTTTTTTEGRQQQQFLHKKADVVVVDVLPTSLPFILQWMPTSGILFYCHYPDKLLLRDATTIVEDSNNNSGRRKKLFQVAKGIYRQFLDSLEERTMALADTLVVNSKFTLGQVERHFPTLSSTTTSTTTTNNNNSEEQERQQQQQLQRYPIEVLYPALDTSTMVQANNQSKNSTTSPIVSLNRFERKKNIGLLLEAYAYLVVQSNNNSNQKEKSLPPLIIAGGYDTKNVENVEYRGELGMLAHKLGIPEYKRTRSSGSSDKESSPLSPPPAGHVEFRLDISDMERATLFQTSLCVVYTPDKEHFGIVPLEAMFAGTPVLAVNSGGPTETVVDGKTGYLRDPTPEAFGTALQQWIDNPTIATEMGRQGRYHVEQTFGTERFEVEWKQLIEETKRRSVLRNNATDGRTRNRNQPHVLSWMSMVIYTFEALLIFVIVLVVTSMLRHVGVLETDQSIIGAVRKQFQGDEL